ncbi:WD40-repeat-containing domain protein [Gorgonomyces haynaldii]|nr:WD40-repeat-containing domain protein [Gorgonomyces haynaldii]
MRVKTISRPEDMSRERIGDIYRVQRNLDPELHPFERAREYTRALRATKMERMFAKPFLGSMEGHIDGVYCMAKNPTMLTSLLSATADGEMRLWNLTTQKSVWTSRGHKGFVRGVTFQPHTSNFVSVGEDKTVKLWSTDKEEPNATFIAKHAFTGVDHHRKDIFATSGSVIELWNHERSTPIHKMSWGAETITSVKFNQTETNILASCGTDRTIILYDIRTNSPIAKSVMALKTNALCWNPMEAFNFTAANEDHNCYSFDMRNLKIALNVAKGHVSAVMDIDYAPTGQEFVTGSYDKTIRIFNARTGVCREIYHTQRMQRAFCVKFSMDSKYVLSGSDDGNIRIWKANAAEKLGTLSNREQAHMDYTKAVKERYKEMPEIKRIDKQRRIPKAIKKATGRKRDMLDAIKRKEDNRRKHSAPGQVPHQAERKKHILKTE